MVYGGDHGEGGKIARQAVWNACLSDLGFVLEISVLLAIGILGDGWVYLEAHRPLLLVCLSCFGCLPPAPLLCLWHSVHLTEFSHQESELGCQSCLQSLELGRILILSYSSILFRVAAILWWNGPKLQYRRMTEFYYCLPSLTSINCSIGRVALLHRVTRRARSWPVFAFWHSLRNFLHLPVCVCVGGRPFFPHGLLTTNPWGQRLKHWQRQLFGRQLQSICSTLFQSGGNI